MTVRSPGTRGSRASLARGALCGALALLAAPVATAQPAGPVLPAGLYDCWIGSMNLGQIALKGDKSRGPAFDGRYEGPAGHYAMSGPTITWDGPLGGLSLAGTIVSTVAKGWDDGTLSGFDVTLQNAGSGHFQTVSCLAPG